MITLNCPLCGEQSPTASVICPKHTTLVYDKDGVLDIKETLLQEIRARSHIEYGEAWQYLANH